MAGGVDLWRTAGRLSVLKRGGCVVVPAANCANMLADGDITQAATDASMVSLVVNGRSLLESKKQEFTAYKNSILYSPLNTPLPTLPTMPVLAALPLGALAAVIPRARQRAERIKAHPNYTTAIGEDCRIVRPAAPIGATQPVLKAVAQTGFQVRLTFAMGGHDQLEIQSKRGSEMSFSMIGFDTNTPYLDARPALVSGQPETRHYRARFIDDGIPFGDWSDTVQVTAND